MQPPVCKAHGLSRHFAEAFASFEASGGKLPPQEEKMLSDVDVRARIFSAVMRCNKDLPPYYCWGVHPRRRELRATSNRVGRQADQAHGLAWTIVASGASCCSDVHKDGPIAFEASCCVLARFPTQASFSVNITSEQNVVCQVLMAIPRSDIYAASRAIAIP